MRLTLPAYAPVAATALPDGTATATAVGTAGQCGVDAFTANPTIDATTNTITIVWSVTSTGRLAGLTSSDTITITLDDGQSQTYDPVPTADTTTTFSFLSASVGVVKWVAAFSDSTPDCEESGQLTLPAYAPVAATALTAGSANTFGTAAQCGVNAFTATPTIDATTNTITIVWAADLTVLTNSDAVTITLDDGQSQPYDPVPTADTTTTFNFLSTSVGVVKWVVTFSDSTPDCEESGELTLPAYAPVAATALPDGTATATAVGTAAQCGVDAFSVNPTIDTTTNTIMIVWTGSTATLTSFSGLTITLDDGQSQPYSTIGIETTTTFNFLSTSAGLVKWVVTFSDSTPDCEESGELTLPTYAPVAATALTAGTPTAVGTAGQCGLNAFAVTPTIDSIANAITIVWVAADTGLAVLTGSATITITLDDGQSQTYSTIPAIGITTTFNFLSDSVGLVKWVVTFSDSTPDCEESGQLTLPAYTAPPTPVPVAATPGDAVLLDFGNADQCGVDAFSSQITIDTTINEILIRWTTTLTTLTSITASLDGAQVQPDTVFSGVLINRFNILADSAGIVRYAVVFTGASGKEDCEESIQLTLPPFTPLLPTGTATAIGLADQCGVSTFTATPTIDSIANTITIVWSADLTVLTSSDAVTITLDDGQSQAYNPVPSADTTTTFNFLSTSFGQVKWVVTFSDSTPDCEERGQLDLPAYTALATAVPAGADVNLNFGNADQCGVDAFESRIESYVASDTVRISWQLSTTARTSAESVVVALDGGPGDTYNLLTGLIVSSLDIAADSVGLVRFVVAFTTASGKADCEESIQLDLSIFATPPLAPATPLPADTATTFGNAGQCGVDVFTATPTINTTTNIITIVWSTDPAVLTSSDAVTITLDDGQSQAYDPVPSAGTTTTFSILPASAGLVKWAVTFTTASGKADCEESGELTLPTYMLAAATALPADTATTFGNAGQCGVDVFTATPTIDTATNIITIVWSTDPAVLTNSDTVTITLDDGQSQAYDPVPTADTTTTFSILPASAGLVKWAVTFTTASGKADCEESGQLALPIYMLAAPTALLTGSATTFGNAGQCGVDVFTATPTIDTTTNMISIVWTLPSLANIVTTTITLDDGQSLEYTAASATSSTTAFNFLSDSVGLVKWVVTFSDSSPDCEESGQLTLPAYVAPLAAATALTADTATTFGNADQCGVSVFTATPTIDAATNTITIVWSTDLNVLTSSDTVTITLDGSQSQPYDPVPTADTTTTFNFLSDSVGVVKWAATFTTASGKADCEESGQLTLPAYVAPTIPTGSLTAVWVGRSWICEVATSPSLIIQFRVEVDMDRQNREIEYTQLPQVNQNLGLQNAHINGNRRQADIDFDPCGNPTAPNTQSNAKYSAVFDDTTVWTGEGGTGQFPAGTDIEQRFGVLASLQASAVLTNSGNAYGTALAAEINASEPGVWTRFTFEGYWLGPTS